MKRLGSAKHSSGSEAAGESKAGENLPGTASRRQDIPGKPSSMVTQLSSGSLPVLGSLLEGKSSVDLGMLPPREMQVQPSTHHPCP